MLGAILVVTAVAYVLVEAVRWLRRPAARRLRALRKINESAAAASRRDLVIQVAQRDPLGRPIPLTRATSGRRSDWWWLP